MESQRVGHDWATQHTYTPVQRETHLHEINTVTGGPEAHVSWSHVREPFKVAEVTLTPSVWYNAEPIWILLPRPEFESWPLLCNLGQVNKMHQGYLYNWKKNKTKNLSPPTSQVVLEPKGDFGKDTAPPQFPSDPSCQPCLSSRHLTT